MNKHKTEFWNTKIGDCFVCDCCGKMHKNNYGFIIKYARFGESGIYRAGLCRKCAKKYMDYMIEGADKTWDKIREEYKKND